MKTDAKTLLKKNPKLNHLEAVKVESHVQRPKDGGYLNTLMLKGYEVPFKYWRNEQYRSLKGAPVNVTYYPETESVAGMDIEIMKVVRVRRF